MVIDRSAVVVIVSVSVALLLPGVGSVTPAGVATEAVLLKVPVALADKVPVAVKVAVPPFIRFTLALILPLPLAGQLELAEAVQVQVTPDSDAGKVSATVAPVTSFGPPLLATMV